MGEIMAVTQDMNLNANGGVLYEFGNEYIVRGVLSTPKVEELGKAVVKTVNTFPVTLEDIADVKIGPKAPKLGTASERGKPAVLMTVTKQPATSKMCIRDRNITAPIAGYVKSILVKEGDYVTIGQPLVSVTQNRRLFLRAEVSEKYYPYLRTINSANFRTPYNNKVYELGALNGRLLSFGKTAGDNSFYVPVTFEFDNKGDIIAGSFVEVYLLSSQLENVLSLPRTALIEEQGIYFVYLQLDEEGYKKQEVTLGADNGKNVQILTGIKPGDRVVTEGAYQVRLASASNAIPAHSHEH